MTVFFLLDSYADAHARTHIVAAEVNAGVAVIGDRVAVPYGSVAVGAPVVSAVIACIAPAGWGQGCYGTVIRWRQGGSYIVPVITRSGYRSDMTACRSGRRPHMYSCRVRPHMADAAGRHASADRSGVTVRVCHAYPVACGCVRELRGPNVHPL